MYNNHLSILLIHYNRFSIHSMLFVTRNVAMPFVWATWRTPKRSTRKCYKSDQTLKFSCHSVSISISLRSCLDQIHTMFSLFHPVVTISFHLLMKSHMSDPRRHFYHNMMMSIHNSFAMETIVHHVSWMWIFMNGVQSS